MIIFLRHAQRGDNQTPTSLSEIEHDPPITNQAQNTILEASRQLAQIFKENKIKKFKIITSKFLRCLMTAQKIQENLEKFGFGMYCHFYEIDDRISEYMREDWFQQYPLNNLIYHTKYKEKYFKDITFKQKQLQRNKLPFPQNYIKFHARVANFKQQLKFPLKDEALLIVTHGFVLRQLSFTMNQLPKYQNEIKYCGYAAYLSGKNGEVLIKSKL